MKWYIGILMLVVVGLFADRVIGPKLELANGYAAKNVCSAFFLSGFEPELVVEQALLGVSPIFCYASVELDSKHVDVSIFGLFKRRAIYQKGLGCRLVYESTKNNSFHEAAARVLKHQRQAEQALKSSINPDVQALAEAGFVEDELDRKRNTKAILVLHRGDIIAEAYGPGVDKDTPLLGWSMAKSVAAILAGIWVEKGLLASSDRNLFPHWQDARKKISLQDLLHMSSGLQFDETYGFSSDVSRMLSLAPDMALYAANRPLETEPGTNWHYSSGDSNLVSKVMLAAVDDDLANFYDLAWQELFTPIGIKSLVFEADASGVPVASSYIYASARDWARLGQLMLNRGRWGAEQVVSESWLDYLVAPNPTNRNHIYGAQWWLNRATPQGEKLLPNLPDDLYAMDGYQGQSVMVLPSEDLVLVRLGFTAHENAGTADLLLKILAKLNPEY